MQTISNGVQAGAERFDSVASLITRYPHLTDAEVEDLKTWFKREATAMDVASLASKESIHAQYTAFRAEHIDRFRAKDFGVAVAVAALAAAIIYYFAFHMAG